MAEENKNKEQVVKEVAAAAPTENNKKKGSKVVKILKIAGFTTVGAVLFGAGFVVGNPGAQKKVKGVFKRGPKTTNENKESVKETNEPQQPAMGQEPQPKNRDFNNNGNYRRQPRNYGEPRY